MKAFYLFHMPVPRKVWVRLPWTRLTQSHVNLIERFSYLMRIPHILVQALWVIYGM